jgi:hypothetical protein
MRPRRNRLKKLFLITAVLVFLLSFQLPASAQALPNQVLALYPRTAGQITFLDVRALRNAPDYPRLKAQVLPERFRQLVEWTHYIGIDFDSDVYQMSWAFLPVPEGQQVGLIGVAEGNFPTEDVQRLARERKLPNSRYAGSLVLSLGKNDQGREFVFAFLDPNTAVFGFRDLAQEVLNRRAGGGPSLLDNRGVVDLVRQLNGKSAVWIAMDNQFTMLAVQQMLPEISRAPGFETLAARLQSATLQLQLSDGFRGSAALRCQTGSDALVVAKLLQAAVTFQAFQLNESKPDLARVLGDLRLNQQDDRVELSLTIAPADLSNLIQKNSLSLKF